MPVTSAICLRIPWGIIRGHIFLSSIFKREYDKEGLMKQPEVKSIHISTGYVPLPQVKTILDTLGVLLREDPSESKSISTGMGKKEQLQVFMDLDFG